MIEILVLGDVCPRWGNVEQFATGDPERVFHDLLFYFQEADYVVGNLEAPITTCEGKLTKTSMNLRAEPADATLLKKAGIDALSLANNHILDYGVSGLEDTISILNTIGISTYGADTLGQEAKALKFMKDSTTIAFLSFAEREFNTNRDYPKGANLWDDIDGMRDIRRAKEEADYLIVQYHGGIEEYEYPSPLLQKKCRAMIEAGADLVTCQHSHCVGTREKWGHGEILYGQGNTVFGYEKNNSSWNDGLLIRILIDNGFSVEYIPITAKPDGVFIQKSENAILFLESFEERSVKISDNEWVKSEWLAFCKKQKNTYLPLMCCWGRGLNKVNRVLRGRLFDLFTTGRSRMSAMNIIRCDAHREVLQTILEQDFYHGETGE